MHIAPYSLLCEGLNLNKLIRDIWWHIQNLNHEK